MGRPLGSKSNKAQVVDDTLKATLAKIEKDFGKGSLIRIGDVPDRQPEEVVSTGSLGLNVALGVGGLPKGRIIEIYGPESSGKTTILLQTIAQAQAKGGLCAIIDAEHAIDLEYAANLGVDVDNLYVCQPDYGEQGLEICDRLVESNKFAIVGVDSIAALVPKAELEGEMGDNKLGLHARLMSQACRKLTGKISKTNTIVFFTNQLREKIGVMFGSPEVTTGGNAMKFYASVRLDIRRQTQIKDGEIILGNKTTVKVVKNKVAPPFRSATFDLVYGEGTDYNREVLDYGIAADIIQQSGSWFAYGETKIGQGIEQVKQFFKDNEELFLEVENKVKEFYFPSKQTEQIVA